MAVDIGTTVEALVASAIEPQPPKEEVRGEVINTVSQDVASSVPDTSIEAVASDVLTPAAEPSTDKVQVAAAGVGKALRLLFKQKARDVADSISERVGEAEKRIYGEERPTIEPLPTKEGFSIPEITDDEFRKLKDAYADIEGTSPLASKAKRTPVLGTILGRVDEGYKKIIQDVRNSHADMFEADKRGVKSFGDALKNAKNVDINQTIRFWLNRKPGEIARPENVIRGTLASIKLFEESKSLWLKVRNTDIEADQIELGKKAMALTETFYKVYSSVSGSTSEAARVMNYQMQMSKSLGPGSLPKNVEDLKFTLYGKKMDNGKDALEMAQSFGMFTGPYEAKKFVEAGFGERSVNFVMSSAINALFTGPATHAAVIGGNAAMLAYGDLVTITASAIGKARVSGASLIGVKANPDRIHARDMLDQLKANYEFAPDAILLAGKALLRGQTGKAAGSKFDLTNQKSFGFTDDIPKAIQMWKEGDVTGGALAMNFLAMMSKSGFRLLDSEDAFFKALAYRKKVIADSNVIANKAYDAAKAAGKSEEESMAARFYAKNEAENNPTTEMVKSGKEAALEFAFQTPLTGRMKNIADGLSHPLTKLWLPVIVAPTNIIRIVNENLPLVGLLNKRMREDILAGGRQRDIAMAKMSLGSMFVGLGAMVAAKYSQDGGEIVITGNGPTNSNQRRTWMAKYAPYSICRRQEGGGYNCNSYMKMTPASEMLGVGADMAYVAANTDNSSKSEAMFVAAISAHYNIQMTTPYMDGARKFSQILKSNDSIEVVGELAKQFFVAQPLEAMAQAATPGLPTGAMGRSIVRGYQPMAKEKGLPPTGVFGEDLSRANPILKGVYEAMNNIISNTPGLSGSLPDRLNMWGEGIPVGAGNLNDVWNPWRTQRKEYNPVVDEIIRLKQYIPEFDRKKGGMEINSTLKNKWIVTSNIMDMAGRLPGEPKYKQNNTMLDVLKEVISPANKGYWELPDNKEQAFKMVEGLAPISSLLRTPSTKKDRINAIISHYRSLSLKMHIYTDKENGGEILKRHVLGGKAEDVAAPIPPSQN